MNFAESEKTRIQKENAKQSDQSKNINFFNSLKKLGKKFEIFEKSFNYSHKNFGITLNVNEFDFKDKEIKMLNFEEPADRKEITNFIENLNDYSFRKLAGNSYINKRFIDIKGKRFFSVASSGGANSNALVGITGKNQNLNINSIKGQGKNNEEEAHREVSDFSNGIVKNLDYKSNNNNSIRQDINNHSNSEINFNNLQHHHQHHKRSHCFSIKLNEMKHEYLLEKAHHNKDASLHAQESLEIFNKLNESTIKGSRQNYTDKIRIEDYNLIVEIFNKHEIIKDIFLINNYIKYSNYSDQLKKQKRNLVKNFTNEIETYRINMKNNRSLSNPVKANLELLNSFLNKIKPNTASSS